MDREQPPLIDLNSATERELTQLPRIGVDMARRIVHRRIVRKGFRDWLDFARASGLAIEDVEAIQGRACIAPAREKEGPSRGRPRHGKAAGPTGAFRRAAWRAAGRRI